jgi:predicted transcriptional regulator
VLALGDGQKSFSRLLAVTKGWQSTLSAALASLLDDGLVGRSGSAFALTAKGCELVTRCRRQRRPRRADRRN